jgi:hypothetical protein
LRVYGDLAAFRRKLRERIRAGQNQLDELAVARERLPPEADDPDLVRGRLLLALEISASVDPTEERLRRWQGGNRGLLADQLGKAGDRLLGPLHRPDGKAMPRNRLANVESCLASEAGALDRVLGLVGTGRQPVRPAGPRLHELEASGLLDPEVVAGYRERMTTLGTRRGASAAIGASKELVEAVHKASLRRMNEPAPSKRDNFLQIARQVRVALQRRKPAPDTEGEATMSLFATHQTGLLQDLDEWRNLYGTGHGRHRLPAGLARRHGQLAVDIAEAYVRFLVTTLVDLRLL